MAESVPRTILITHDDLDGATCAVLFCYYFKVSPDQVIFTNYENLKDIARKIAYEDRGNTILYFTDLRLTPDIIGCLKGMWGSVRIFDHHVWNESDIREAQQIKLLEHDVTRCASHIFFDYLVQEELFNMQFTKEDCTSVGNYWNLVLLTEDYNLWRHNFVSSKYLNMLFHLLGPVPFVKRFLSNPSPNLSVTEEMFVFAAIEKEKQYINYLLKRDVYIRQGSGYKMAIAFSSQHISALGQEMLKKFGVDLAVIINLERSEISLRSTDKVDCSKIASRCEGGGHPRAAGFPIKHGGYCTAPIADLVNRLAEKVNGERDKVW